MASPPGSRSRQMAWQMAIQPMVTRSDWQLEGRWPLCSPDICRVVGRVHTDGRCGHRHSDAWQPWILEKELLHVRKQGANSRSRLQSYAAFLDVSFANNMHCSRIVRTSLNAASSDPTSFMMWKCVVSSIAKKGLNTTPSIVLLDDESHSLLHPIHPLSCPTTTPPSSNPINLPIESCFRLLVKILFSHLLLLKPIFSTGIASVEQPNFSR